MSSTTNNFKLAAGFLKSHAEHLHARATAMHADKDTQRAIESHARECDACVEFITDVIQQNLAVESAFQSVRENLGGNGNENLGGFWNKK